MLFVYKPNAYCRKCNTHLYGDLKSFVWWSLWSLLDVLWQVFLLAQIIFFAQFVLLTMPFKKVVRHGMLCLRLYKLVVDHAYFNILAWIVGTANQFGALQGHFVGDVGNGCRCGRLAGSYGNWHEHGFVP